MRLDLSAARLLLEVFDDGTFRGPRGGGLRLVPRRRPEYPDPAIVRPGVLLLRSFPESGMPPDVAPGDDMDIRAGALLLATLGQEDARAAEIRAEISLAGATAVASFFTTAPADCAAELAGVEQ